MSVGASTSLRRARIVCLAAAALALHASIAAAACADTGSCVADTPEISDTSKPPCPCESPELCQSITKRHDREVRIQLHGFLSS